MVGVNSEQLKYGHVIFIDAFDQIFQEYYDEHGNPIPEQFKGVAVFEAKIVKLPYHFTEELTPKKWGIAVKALSTKRNLFFTVFESDLDQFFDLDDLDDSFQQVWFKDTVDFAYKNVFPENPRHPVLESQASDDDEEDDDEEDSANSSENDANSNDDSSSSKSGSSSDSDEDGKEEEEPNYFNDDGKSYNS